MAKKTGNTPDGLQARRTPGPRRQPHVSRDKSGALASLNSVAKLSYDTCRDGISNTFSITPQALGKNQRAGGQPGSILTNTFGQKAHHLNVNVLNRETLMGAYEHPEKYPNLTIRVSGYAVNFYKLSGNSSARSSPHVPSPPVMRGACAFQCSPWGLWTDPDCGMWCFCRAAPCAAPAAIPHLGIRRRGRTRRGGAGQADSPLPPLFREGKRAASPSRREPLAQPRFVEELFYPPPPGGRHLWTPPALGIRLPRAVLAHGLTPGSEICRGRKNTGGTAGQPFCYPALFPSPRKEHSPLGAMWWSPASTILWRACAASGYNGGFPNFEKSWNGLPSNLCLEKYWSVEIPSPCRASRPWTH